MVVKKGDKVKIEYTGTLDDGTVFDSTSHGDHTHPLEFVAGEGQVIPGFDREVLGMKVGEEKEFNIPSSEAYGPIIPEAVKEFPRDLLQTKEEPKVGMGLLIGTPEGQRIPAKITAVTKKTITLDLNHPLAGKNLNFKIKLVK